MRFPGSPGLGALWPPIVRPPLPSGGLSNVEPRCTQDDPQGNPKEDEEGPNWTKRNPKISEMGGSKKSEIVKNM